MFGNEKKIRARFVFEILGKPADYIKQALSELIDSLAKFKGITIIEKTVHEAKEYENESKVKGFFTTFGEVEVTSDDLNGILNIVLNYLPAHVEIIEPEELRFSNCDLSNTLSALASKLHQYDEVAKTLTMDRNILLNKLKEAEARLKALDNKKIENTKPEKITKKNKNK
jgi:hypothetical protein